MLQGHEGRAGESSIRGPRLKPKPRESLVSTNACCPILSPIPGTTVPLHMPNSGLFCGRSHTLCAPNCQLLAECGAQPGLSKYLGKEGSCSTIAGVSHPDMLPRSPVWGTSHPEPWPPYRREKTPIIPRSAPSHTSVADSHGREGAVTLYDLAKHQQGWHHFISRPGRPLSVRQHVPSLVNTDRLPLACR